MGNANFSASLQVLEVVRVMSIIQALQDVRELPAELVFLNRTPVVPAVDDEVMGRFVGRVQIADLVSDDAAAAVYSSGKLTFETTTIPNLKHGTNLTQSQLNQLMAINGNGGIANDQGIYSDFKNNIIDGLLLGIRQRMEALIVAMNIDGFSYDRLGIKMSNVTWGMPADLKVTTAVTWDTAATATPVADILLLKRLAQVRYGIVYDRITMSLSAFNYMTNTLEFQNRVKIVFPLQFTQSSALPIQNTDYMRNLATNVMGLKEIEIYDSRYWSQSTDGTLMSAPYLPITKVVLSSTGNDNNQQAMDFANAYVTESIVGSLAGSNIVGQFTGAARGPVAYATVPGDLNPPNITMWGVSRGFPRKKLLQATAVLTVGSFTDPIAVGEPF